MIYVYFCAVDLYVSFANIIIYEWGVDHTLLAVHLWLVLAVTLLPYHLWLLCHSYTAD